LFIEHIIKKIKDHFRGISINSHQIHSIRFTDNIVLLANSEEELILMLYILDSSLDKFKLKINFKKTKIMVINKVKTNPNITLNNEQKQQVNELCYLGSLIINYNKATKEIITNKHLSIISKKTFINVYIWSILLHGCEMWTIGKYKRDRLEAIAIWMRRK